MLQKSLPVILAGFLLAFLAFLPSAEARVGQGPEGLRTEGRGPQFAQTSGPTLRWNTFLGSAEQNNGFGVAVDAAGNSYVTGDSPASWGSPILPFAGARDVFIAKLDPNGTLEWNTFLGGPSYDTGYAIAVDPEGNICVAGFSWTTWGSPVRPFTGAYDAFLAKLDPNGTLLWNTFLGGANYDIAYGIASDASANLYVTGHSFETWGSPVLPFSGGSDIFAAKVDKNGSLLWNTFMGSSTGDTGSGIAVDSNGNSLVTGYSSETWGSPVISHGEGLDAFVAKLNTNGALQWNAFLGGTGNDTGNGIGVDAAGNVYVAGYCPSGWGTPLSPFEGTADAFLAKLSGNGALQWNTFLGGTGADWGNGVAVAADGNAYVTGMSRATWGAPVRPYSLQDDAFVAAVDAEGALRWNTFLGGDGVDEGYGIAVNAEGDSFVLGSSDAAWGSAVLTFPGGVAAFAAKVEGEKGFTVSASPDSVTVNAGQSASYAVLVEPAGTTFDSAVTFACAGLPRGCTASFSPDSVTPGGSPAATALTLATKSSSAAVGGTVLAAAGPVPPAGLLLASVLLASLAWYGARRRSPTTPPRILGGAHLRILMAAALICVIVLGASCGGGDGGSSNNGTPSGTYEVTVKGTSGSLTASTTVTLVVK